MLYTFSAQASIFLLIGASLSISLGSRASFLASFVILSILSTSGSTSLSRIAAARSTNVIIISCVNSSGSNATLCIVCSGTGSFSISPV